MNCETWSLDHAMLLSSVLDMSPRFGEREV